MSKAPTTSFAVADASPHYTPSESHGMLRGFWHSDQFYILRRIIVNLDPANLPGLVLAFSCRFLSQISKNVPRLLCGDRGPVAPDLNTAKAAI